MSHYCYFAAFFLSSVRFHRWIFGLKMSLKLGFSSIGFVARFCFLNYSLDSLCLAASHRDKASNC